MLGYQASHEQFTPSELLRYSAMAETAGFTSINSSDHFYPWSKRQGQSGYSFSWLGASMAQTALPYGVVCTPGYRNHPAIVAQATATLAEMFPDRFWIALGSGEALNERITGEKFPIKAERNERLKECADIIKRLLSGETVTYYGRVTLEEVRLYTLPKVQPLVIGAAVTKETAAWMGGWADGLITVHQEYQKLKEVVEAYRNNGGGDKPVFLKAQLSYAASEEEALQGAWDQWRTNIFKSTPLAELWQVEQFDMIAEFVQPAEVKQMVRVSADIDQHIAWIEEDMKLGFERIVLHNVNREQELFIRHFGEKVLPRFQKK